jgi:hypothetical protein
MLKSNKRSWTISRATRLQGLRTHLLRGETAAVAKWPQYRLTSQHLGKSAWVEENERNASLEEDHDHTASSGTYILETVKTKWTKTDSRFLVPSLNIFMKPCFP